MTTILSLTALTPNKLGSYEEFEIQIAHQIRQLGWKNVKIFHGVPKDNLLTAFQNTGCELHVIPERSFNTLGLVKAKSLIKKYKPDVLHISFFPLTTPLSILAYLSGVKKIVITDHFSGMPRNYSALKEWLRLLRIKFATFPIDQFIAVSGFVAERLITRSGIPPKKVRIIYNGINTQRFSGNVDRQRVLRDLSISSNQFLFITVAHLIKNKGMQYLLDAVRLLLEKNDKITLLIVGTGPELETLQAQSSALMINTNVYFAGLRDDVHLLLASADAFVFPAVWNEAFGLSIVEAMASGLPVIASGVGGIPELINDKITGLLVSPRNSIELADAMMSVITNKSQAKALGHAAHEEACSRFNLDRMVSETISVYRKLLENS